MEHDDIGQCLLHFSVQDSGIGLSGTDRKNYLNLSRKVMHPLRQFGGTGLGLLFLNSSFISCMAKLVLRITKNVLQQKRFNLLVYHNLVMRLRD